MVDDEKRLRPSRTTVTMEDEELFLNFELDSVFNPDEALSNAERLPFESPMREVRLGEDAYQAFRSLALTAFVSNGSPKQPWHDPPKDKPDRQLMVIDMYVFSLRD